MINIQLFDKKENNQFSDKIISQVAFIESQVQPNNFWIEKVISDLLKLDYNYLLLACFNGEIVGYCLYQVMFETAEILRIGTLPQQQRQGIGTKLLNFLVQELQQNHLETNSLLLEVRADNLPAINLYQKQGFQQIDCRKNYYQDVDGLIMRKLLKN
ncbi:MAG: ribosomal protein S18-alanine N-acetyltransferase [Pasteurella sp.]|nr:ribosomal protein S18-alanine N-acetyltransferase [Pasteurella sp.]